MVGTIIWRNHSSNSPTVAHVVLVPNFILLKEMYTAWMERVGLALELVVFVTLKCISSLVRSMNSISFTFFNSLPGLGLDVDSIARSDLKLCSKMSLLALEFVHSIRRRRLGRA